MDAHLVDEPLACPAPKPHLTNYLIVYAYGNGEVNFHCSNIDPVFDLKMIAIMADAMSNAMKQLQQQKAKEESRIHLVNGG